MKSQDTFAALADQLADEIAEKVRERLAATHADERAAFSVEEVAKKLGLGVRSVRRLLDQGSLRHVSAGTRVLIPASAVAEFLRDGGNA